MSPNALEIIVRLSQKSEISDYEVGVLISMDEMATRLIEALRKTGKISALEHAVLHEERERHRKKKTKAAMRRIDRKSSRRGSPAVQGGLPSLGKRRP